MTMDFPFCTLLPVEFAEHEREYLRWAIEDEWQYFRKSRLSLLIFTPSPLTVKERIVVLQGALTGCFLDFFSFRRGLPKFG